MTTPAARCCVVYRLGGQRRGLHHHGFLVATPLLCAAAELDTERVRRRGFVIAGKQVATAPSPPGLDKRVVLVLSQVIATIL